MKKKETEPAPSYEELRRRKLEENKKKLEELKLGHLSLTLREALAPKTFPAKQVKRKVPPQELDSVVVRRSSRIASLPTADSVVVRRSSSVANLPTVHSMVVRRSDRVANLPHANYKEVDLDSDSDTNERTGRIRKRRDLSGRVGASDEAKMYAQTRAEEVQSELEPKFPSFVRTMLQSHGTGGFWLGLPEDFCIKYLPKHVAPITLIDEEGEGSDTLYLAQKKGFSDGCKGFSIAHGLVDGDALVFQLIQPTTFKVYIIRASGYDSS